MSIADFYVEHNIDPGDPHAFTAFLQAASQAPPTQGATEAKSGRRRSRRKRNSKPSTTRGPSLCSICNLEHQSSGFSANQLRKPPGTRRCKLCLQNKYVRRICSFPGCSLLGVPEGYPGNPGFCSANHAARAAASGYAMIPDSLGGVERIYKDSTTANAATVRVLKKSHPKYAGVRRQFLESWCHPFNVSGRPIVQRVLQIRNPFEVYARYERYKAALQRKHGMTNEVRRFHGTRLGCEFGVNPNCGLCQQPGEVCAVCSLIRGGLDKSKVTGSWQRFGRGFYFSQTSSKANDYVKMECAKKRMHGKKELKIIFLCKVALGSSYTTTTDRTDLQAPPCGKDSVVGEASVSGSLNYNETVVYREDAAIPSYASGVLCLLYVYIHVWNFAFAD